MIKNSILMPVMNNNYTFEKMATNSDMKILKDIPGYKAILKSVLKSQIQLLIAQLSDQTGEESIILTASLNDGTLSHLGSNTGLGFLDGRDEIKSQFLGYCLNNQHKKVEVANSTPYQHSRTFLPRSHRPRIRSGPYTLPSSSFPTPIRSPSSYPLSQPIRSPSSYPLSPSIHDKSIFNQSNHILNSNFITENIADNLLDNIEQSSKSNITSTMSCNEQDMVSNQNTAFNNSSQPLDDSLEGSQEAKVKLKVEAASGDDELEASGINTGDNSHSSDAWGQPSFDRSIDGNDAGEDQTEYNPAETDQMNQASQPLGGIAFPGLDNAHHDFKNFEDLSPTELNRALYPEGLAILKKIYANMSNGTVMNDMSDFNKSPRKRGRPRKIPSIPEPVTLLPKSEPHDVEENNTSDLSMDVAMPLQTRGRPRKEPEFLPPGTVRPTGICIGNGYVRCNICGKILKSTSMFSHKQTHLGIKNYRCDFCGKSFTQKGPLITHRRVHTGEKPYSCVSCGKNFAAQSGVYQHSRRCPGRQMNITF